MDVSMEAFYRQAGAIAIAYARIAPVFYLLPFLNDRTIVNGLVKNTIVFAVIVGLWPSFAHPPFSADLPRVGALLTDLVAHGLALAAPVLIVMFVTDALLGLFSRFCPQVNAFSLSLTVKSIVAFAVFHLYFVYAAPHELTALLHAHPFGSLVK